VKPSHPSAGRFSCFGFFDGLGRFSDFETNISALSTTKEIGDVFEGQNGAGGAPSNKSITVGAASPASPSSALADDDEGSPEGGIRIMGVSVVIHQPKHPRDQRHS